MTGGLVIRGGDVLEGGGAARADVLIVDGVITDVGRDLEAPSEATELDASGCIVAPGLVDLLADLGGPDDLERETPVTGSVAAALGGFTSVLVTSTPASPIDSAAAMAARRSLDPGLVRLHYAAAMTMGHGGAALAPMAELARAGVSWFTDVVSSCASTDLLRNAFEYANGLPAQVGFALPVEDPSFARDGVMHEGAVSARLGLAGRPEIAERMGAERLVALAELTGARLLLGPFSSAAALECTELRAQAVNGLDERLTTWTSPAHLLFTDEDCAGFETSRRFDPPLRPEPLGDMLLAGFLGCVASGHRPHPAQHDELPFDLAPAGGASLASAVAVAAAAPHRGELEIADVVRRMSCAPARLLGAGAELAPGQIGDVCVIDPDAEWTTPARPTGSLAATTPYGGIQCRTKVRHTIVEGVAVVREGELVRERDVVMQKGQR